MDELYAQTYDVWMSDWPGEIDFYRQLVAEEVTSKQGMVLDIACGTGRIALRLAETGTSVVGLDHSPEMLEIARQKSENMKHVHWIEGDMRSFKIDQPFELAIIPSHSFQNLTTADDQASCIQCIWRHLRPGKLLCVHLDHMNDKNTSWLGRISNDNRGEFQEAGQFRHPETGMLVKTWRAWTYEPASQTAIKRTAWVELDQDGQPIRRWERGPIRLHCVFRFEMEHLLRRAGFEIEHIYGDFSRGDLRDGSAHMIWLARKPENG